MRKSALLAVFAAAVCAAVLCGCDDNGGAAEETAPALETNQSGFQPGNEGRQITLNVVTTYSGNDGNGPKYREYAAKWEDETGNIVNDSSATSDEAFKNRVLADFEIGIEPDVLFYFSGVDSNPFVEAGKVVTIDEIREVYPDYASNMEDRLLGASPADGKNYSVPVNGYWEGMFVNKSVLEACGVEAPGEDYTWERFITDCERIKAAGYTPVAVSLADVPHYWFEYSIYNHLGTAAHSILPELPGAGVEADEENIQFKAWVSGLEDIKDLYERGFFPSNTLSATDNDTFRLFVDGQAAFLVDGSWKVGVIENNFKKSDDDKIEDMDDEYLRSFTEAMSNFTVTFFPAKEKREATEAIGGLSSGYYITRKAWNDPEKREAAVSFVMFMTSDETVSDFAAVSATALKNGSQVDLNTLSPLAADGLEYTKQLTGMSEAVQDKISADARAPIFGNMSEIVTGKTSPADAVRECLKMIAEEQ